MGKKKYKNTCLYVDEFGFIHVFKEKWKEVTKVEINGNWYDVAETRNTKKIFVSNCGRIKRIYNNDTQKISFGTISKNKYMRIKIYYHDNDEIRIYQASIHRLVSCAFINKKEDMNIPNHLDNDGTNNCYWNLEWTNTSGNRLHANEIGAYSDGKYAGLKGSKNITSILSEEIVSIIIEMLLKDKSNKDICKYIKNLGLGCSNKIIGDIRNKKSWTHMTTDYDFPKDTKVPEEIVHSICKLIIDNKTNNDISNELSLSKYIYDTYGYILDIRNKRRKVKISNQYFKEPYKLA